MLKNSAFVIALLVSVPAIFGASKAKQADATTIEGDLYGAARIRCVTKAGSDTGYVTELNVGGAGNGDFSGTGVYLRMKNNTGTDTPITMKFNSTNGTAFGPKTSVNHTYYDLNGVETTGCAARTWGNYLMLPANFDGFIYMNYTTQMSKIFGDADFDPAHMWRVYIEYSGFYDAYADFTIGDIFTDAKKVLDGSELDAAGFAATWINQTGAAQEITQLEKAPEPYTPGGDLYGAARITCITAAGSDTGYVTELNAGGAGNGDFTGSGVYLRMKNYTSTETPITMKFNSTNGVAYGPKPSVDHTYYDKDLQPTTGTAARTWGNYLMLPANFDGFIYLDYNTQMSKIFGDGSFNPSSMWRVYIEYSGFYDSYADFAIGDIFTDVKSVVDGSELDASAFAATWINQTGAVQSVTQLARSESFMPSGDLLGGVRATMSGYDGFIIKGSELVDLSTGGLYMRIKNNESVTRWPMLHVASDWYTYRVVTAQGQLIDRYNANGEYVDQVTVNEWGYFELPANFDGFIKMHWDGAANDWGTEFSNTKVIAVYFEADTFDVSIGDIFSEDNVFFDGSEHYASEFPTWLETWTGAVTFELLEGSKPAPLVFFDYTQITYTVGLEGGVNVTAKKNPDNSVFSYASINFSTRLDLSAGEAVAISFKGNGSYAFGLEFHDEDGNSLIMPAPADAAIKPIYFIKDGVASAMNHTTGDPNTIHEIAGEGVIVIEKDFLAVGAGADFDWAHVASIKVKVHTYYDHGINIVLGDIGTVTQSTLAYNCVFDVSELLNWSTYYSAGDEFVVVKEYSLPKASTWIGDVKLIDSLNYKDDEEMNKAITYDDGNNPCSYHRQDGGIWIHNGPYEVEGHAYGPYMCLAFFDQGATTDRCDAFRMVNEQKEYAKGMTFYAKNLSNKEIGVTLQFDETIPGKSYTERWCIVGYPALYYAWDVNTNAEYMFYSKSDQVQIPVGFEGYIRVPFESYSVPEWNKGQEGVDEVIDLDLFSGNLFFTSDNTRYEDLEYVIKDLGMYFNETRKGNMFDNSHTIKANMGL